MAWPHHRLLQPESTLHGPAHMAVPIGERLPEAVGPWEQLVNPARHLWAEAWGSRPADAWSQPVSLSRAPSSPPCWPPGTSQVRQPPPSGL